jgi:hypothetical protein
MERFSKIVTLTYASVSLRLGWLSAAIGFLFLAGAVVGIVVGHAVWSFACTIIAAATGRRERQPPKQKESAPNGYA